MAVPPLVQKQDKERQDRTKQEQADRERENNPTTQSQRQYGSDAPGMHPANLPSDRVYEEGPLIKGTRVDLEDVTGNPGHRGVNPNAPATSINPGPNHPDARHPDPVRGNAHPGSINEPPHVEPPSRAQQMSGEAPLAGQGVAGSINEPPGSTIGANMPGEEPPPSEAPVVLSSISPESVTIGPTQAETFTLTANGSGFTEESVIVFNDEDLETTLVSDTVLTAEAPTATEANTVDVEVANGEDLSDAITFEYLVEEAGATRAPRKPAQRKPSKGKRDKSKAKSKKR